MSESRNVEPVIRGRYAIFDVIAAGGMGSVHYARMLGSAGFSRTVAIKRLHPKHAGDPEYTTMLLDEARLAARIRHPNVVPTLDVVSDAGELLLVMDFVQGESLSRIATAARKKGEKIPVAIVSAILSGALHGLHAAHEATNDAGEPLRLVHRDVSPQNLLVGADGVPRVLDFGVAKAEGRAQETRDGSVKGKLAYMAPEQLAGREVNRRTDVYAMAIVLWETLTGVRLFDGENEGIIVRKVLAGTKTRPSELAPEVSAALDDVVMLGLAHDPSDRFATARDMAIALENAVRPALASEVATLVERLAADTIRKRGELIATIERTPLPFRADSSRESAATVVAPIATARTNDETRIERPAPSTTALRFVALFVIAAIIIFGAAIVFILVTPPEPLATGHLQVDRVRHEKPPPPPQTIFVVAAPPPPVRSASSAVAAPPTFHRPRIGSSGGKCMHIAGDNTLVIWDCTDGVEQDLRFASGAIKDSTGRCMGTFGNTPANHERATMQACDGSATQKWMLDGPQIKGVMGNCLDSSFKQSGSPIVLWTCSSRDEQRWAMLHESEAAPKQH